MSGRSAFARIHNKEGRPQKRTSEIARVNENYSGQYPYLPSHSNNHSYTSSPQPSHRRRSLSSSGSAYRYPSVSIVRPPPNHIIIASGIEKSELRTHFDGLSETVRTRFGKLFKGGDDHHHHHHHHHPFRPKAPGRLDLANMCHDEQPPYRGLTPPIEAVPPLSPSTSPEAASFPTVARQMPSPTTRERQQQTDEARQDREELDAIRRFWGGGPTGAAPDRDWTSIHRNPELWNRDGDTYVFMYAEGSTLKPPPSLRIDSAVIEKSGSRTLIDKLFCEDVPPGWPSFRLKFAKEKHKQEHEDSLRGFPKYEPGCGITDCDYLRRHLGLEKHRRIPTTERIYHEIYIAWPGPECMVHSTMWHIATRNFFSVLLGARSLVGITLYESWVWLLDRFAMDPDYLDRNTDRVAWITDYLVRYKFTDVRNNPSYAASLLAFSERYQWREGYIEAFVHCVGMLTLGVKTIPEWRYIQPLTKQFLENASMEQDLRIHYAQNFLRSFDLSRMWPTCSAPPSSARAAFNRLQKWLCRYYEAAFGQWPPNSGERWLKLEHMKRLQTDFYGLYDYLVDREVQFELIDPSKNTWAITHQNNVNFRSDTNELAFKDMVVGFDDRYGFPHIPHPYPNTPSSVPVYGKPKSASPFSMKKPPTPSELQVLTKRKALSYAKASNVYSTPGQCMNAELVAHFVKFEQEDMVDSLDPFEARLGRWILIYGVLQVLATLAVYSPNLQYAEGCHYFLSPQMKGLVPWSQPGSPPEEEAEHTRSHCWTVPKTWGVHMHQSRKSPYQPIVLEQYGDGRAHDEDDDEVEKVIPASKAQATESDIAHMRTDNNSHERSEEWGADSHKVNPDYNVEQSPHEHGVLQDGILPEDGLGGPGIDNHDNHDGLGLDEERSGGHPTEPSRRRRVVSIFTDEFVPIGWTEEELQELRGG